MNTKFNFGKNWLSFISTINAERINNAKNCLLGLLELESLEDKSFIDIGSGSGLSSLVARQAGASVVSFDYDNDSVDCTRKLQEKFFPSDEKWKISRGSILNKTYVNTLGKFDIVYSWGVLHHTGFLYEAIYNAHLCTADRGILFIAIYNDQGIISSIWHIIKKFYNLGSVPRIISKIIFFTLFFIAGLLIDIFRFRNPVKRYSEHKKIRGMSLMHDWKDWLGGYPYEAARPERIISYVNNLGYKLSKVEYTKHGFGNNQYVFKKIETIQDDN